MSQFICLATNLTEEEADIQEIADSYRWRWQIEREFKRFKSSTYIRKLPNHKEETVRVYILAAFIAWLISNKIAQETFFSMGLSHTTISRYIDILEGLFIVRQLQAWHGNIKKRQVKSPKIYFRDSGLLHELLNIKTHFELMTNPKLGPSWEGYIITEILSAWKPDEFYFWATHNGAELDLLLFKDGKRIGVECKRADAPRMTRSIHIALETLELDRLIVIYPGDKSYPLTDKVTVMPLTEAISLPELSSTGY
jgi:predicted AAA+ superfamily ATPase